MKPKDYDFAKVYVGVTQMLEGFGFGIFHDDLQDTPHRVAKAWEEMLSGYKMNPEEILSTHFEAKHYDQAIVVGPIEFYSMCEHHLLPFFGEAYVAYVPHADGDQRLVVGLSKIARLVECFARRLQLQERLTEEIAEAVETHARAKGVAVVVKAKHMCMCSRGVRSTRAMTVTSKMTGCFYDKPEARAEVLELIKEAGRG